MLTVVCDVLNLVPRRWNSILWLNDVMQSSCILYQKNDYPLKFTQLAKNEKGGIPTWYGLILASPCRRLRARAVAFTEYQ